MFKTAVGFYLCVLCHSCICPSLFLFFKQSNDEYKVIVNCTPVGMYPRADECPDIPYQLLTPQHFLFHLD